MVILEALLVLAALWLACKIAIIASDKKDTKSEFYFLDSAGEIRYTEHIRMSYDAMSEDLK